MGVVYHANYLPWCEIARTQLLAEVGLPYARLQDLGFLLPVLEINLKYRAPARFGDLVSVRARMCASASTTRSSAATASSSRPGIPCTRS